MATHRCHRAKRCHGDHHVMCHTGQLRRAVCTRDGGWIHSRQYVHVLTDEGHLCFMSDDSYICSMSMSETTDESLLRFDTGR